MLSLIRPLIILAACATPLAPCLADGSAAQDSKLMSHFVGRPTLAQKLARCNRGGRSHGACRTTPLMK